MTLLFALVATLFTPIDTQVLPTPFSYSGQAAPREILTLDPNDCPLLDAIYTSFVTSLPADVSELEILSSLLNTIHFDIFTPALCKPLLIEPIVAEYRQETASPMIPLEVFVAKKTGICRHQALTAAWLLYRLEMDGWIKGPSEIVRGNLKRGRHAWNTVWLDNQLWIFDAFWGNLCPDHPLIYETVLLDANPKDLHEALPQSN